VALEKMKIGGKSDDLGNCLSQQVLKLVHYLVPKL
jgi:hypothetical protein